MSPVHAPSPAGSPTGDDTAAAPAKPPAPKPEDDARRRATEQAAEEEARAAHAAEIIDGMRLVRDGHGLILMPDAELGDTDVLGPFLVRDVKGDLPNGVPRDLTDELQGKRIDFAVKVEFLSEVFVEAAPLTKPVFEERAEEVQIGASTVKRLEVLAPRLGAGTFYRRERAGVFVSRSAELAIPDEVVATVLDAQS